jgi:hypothetical protein
MAVAARQAMRLRLALKQVVLHGSLQREAFTLYYHVSPLTLLKSR